jgi:uncharacterized protein DUF3761/surface-adhesin protein E
MRSVALLGALLGIASVFTTPSSIASPPNWVPISSTSDYSLEVFLDSSSIKVRSGRLTAWLKYNWVLPQTSPGEVPKPYQSKMSLEAFDCASERSGPIAINFYSGRHGEGLVVDSWSGEAATISLSFYPPGTMGQSAIDAVCRLAPSKSPKIYVGHDKEVNPSPRLGMAARSDTNLKDPTLLENGYYVNSVGHVVHSPAHTVTGAAPVGASAKCSDGTYSFSEHRSGTCSHHGGVTTWLN